MTPERSIHSIKDEKVVEARSLQSSKGRLASGKCLLEGKDHIHWAMERSWHIDHVFVYDHEKDSAVAKTLLQTLRTRGIPLFICSEGIIKKITDTNYLVPFVGVATHQTNTKHTQKEFLIVLDHLQDLGNVGTIVRTAAAFGLHDFVSTEQMDLFYKKTIDASRGTVFAATLRSFSSGSQAIAQLKKEGYQIVVTTPHASRMQSFAHVEQKPIALIYGNETNGVSEEIMRQADLNIHIPMSGQVESLNVGVAAGISLYEMKIKWTLAMLTKKIQTSIARDLFCASRWMRLLFDAELRKSTPLNADQAIMMMILKCDQTSTEEALTHDAGLSQKDSSTPLIQSLVDQGFIARANEKLTLLEKGEEALAKIWPLHELTEHLALEGVSSGDKEVFLHVLGKILKNCEKITPYE